MTPHDRRLGRFEIRDCELRRWRDLMPLFAGMVVVDVRRRWDTASAEYLAYSDLFEESNEATEAPWYSFTFERTLSGEILTKCTKGKEPPL